MSVSLILIPAAIAAVTAISATGVGGVLSLAGRSEEKESAGADADTAARPVAVQTRMKDPELLGDALRDIGAVTVSVTDAGISAELDDIAVTMTRTPEAVWAAHLERLDGHELGTAEATALIQQLDAAYALRVQQAVAERIRTRADTAGFELVSETRDEDDTVTMVLNVKDYA
ncbi:MAG: hypothetical protein WBX17_01065 [Microbacterium sp.]